jgi:uridine phosphorylase
VSAREYHLQLEPGEIGGYVLLPGDPGRCALIAARFDIPQHLRSNREYTTYTGMLDGAAVGVTSTGIGGPSTAIAIEELHALGVHTVVRVGTCGSMRDEVNPGDVVIAQAAIRDEGTTHQYVGAGVPAVASALVVDALRVAAHAPGTAAHLGTVVSTDSFYAQRNADTMPLAVALRERWDGYRRGGALAAEMETAAVLVVSAVRGMRAGSVLAVIDRIAPTPEPMPPADHLPLDSAIDIAVGALRDLIARDNAGSS